jgi:hypothetical protein
MILRLYCDHPGCDQSIYMTADQPDVLVEIIERADWQVTSASALIPPRLGALCWRHRTDGVKPRPVELKPPLHPNCRCQPVPVADNWLERALTARYTGWSGRLRIALALLAWIALCWLVLL